ncbi:phage portal protein [Arthrobacter rhombi]|uniref:phage portal protein n=1 Tax=Arthrobacter rhombi TaxID=71253 RepID=UPI003FD0839F
MASIVSQGQLTAISRPTVSVASRAPIAVGYAPDYSQIWRRHGSVQTVVNFLGRNIASLGLHMFERVDDTDRRRITDHPLARMLGTPNPWTTHYNFFDALVRDLAIFERFLAVKIKSKTDESYSLVRIPASMYEIKSSSWLFAEAFEVRGSNGKRMFTREEVLFIDGYSPDGDLGGVSSIESLREILAEEYEAARMRAQTFRNGARTSGYIQRPAGAPKWSNEGRERFRAGWRSQYAGSGGSDAAGTPVLEDGMEYVSASQSAKDLQYIESRKLTREEVASAYFIPPPMIGLLDHATFSNIKEQHKSLYQDTLGPWLKRIVEELQLQLLGDFSGNGGRFYLEFNLEEKMRGSFEEQAAQLQQSVGGPWMSRNEARAMRNLQAIEGGDDLIVPLNVVTGGQASPADSGSQNVGGEAAAPAASRQRQVKAVEYELKAPEEIPADHQKAMAKVFSRFFTRQRAVVLSAAGAKSPDWWDAERWNEELSEDILDQSLDVTKATAEATLVGMGIDPDEYSTDRTKKFLKKVSDRISSQVNDSTAEALEAAFSGDDPDAAAHVFDIAADSRADQSGMTAAATFVGFAMVEAARQTKPKARKRWQVNSGNPRATHASMNGEEVPIDEEFSNGMPWPASFNGDVDEVAGCQCSVVIIN